MANFNSMVLTNKGQVLYAKAQAGATINFTKLAVGTGNIGTTDPTTLTELINRKFNIAIQGKTVNTLEKVALISGTLTNESMTESVYIQEIGIYAQDPDDGEILYGYASAGQYGDYTSPASNGPYSWNYQVYAAIGNAANVTVTLSNLQYDTAIVNTNTTFSVIQGSNQKEINLNIDTKFHDLLYVTAGGTATAITLSLPTLVNGYSKTFIATANNSGTATTINGKSLYKPGTTAAPNLIAGKAYTVWYNSTNDCFFIKASADGNTTADHVLANDTFSNDVDTGLVGTLVDNYNNDNIECTPTVSGNTLKLTIPTTARYKQGNHLQITDSDFIASNIINGVNLFGITGSATIESLGGKQFASGSVYRNDSSFFTVNLPFTPNFIVTMDNAGMMVNIRQTAFSWYYTDIMFYTSDYNNWSGSTTNNTVTVQGQPFIVIGTNSFTWQAMSGQGNTINYIALKI